MADQSIDEQQSVSNEDLPAVFRASSEQQKLLVPKSCLDEYLNDDFSLDKFEALGDWLFVAGRPYPPRPLNIQAVLRREIIPTSDISLHLVWTSGRIFLKPVPRYFFSDDFYKQHLKTPKDEPKYDKPAFGFLYTYLALVPSELDFVIAQEKHLLPIDCKWSSWKLLAETFLTDHKGQDLYDHIPIRYKYGELRLSRLDKVSRYRKGNLHHGWSTLTGNTRYYDFVVTYLSPIAATIAYVVVLLSALQVGLATEQLGNTPWFQDVAAGFTVFALLSPVVSVTLVLIILFILFFVNLIKSWQVRKQQDHEITIKTQPSAQRNEQDRINRQINAAARQA